jgi:hypothetical protein
MMSAMVDPPIISKKNMHVFCFEKEVVMAASTSVLEKARRTKTVGPARARRQIDDSSSPPQAFLFF